MSKETDFRKFYRSKNPYKMTTFDDYVKKSDRYLNPYIIEERPMNAVTIDVFSRLMMERQIFFGTFVDSDSSNICVSQLLYLDSIENTDITIYVNSGGGSIYDGNSILDAMDFVKSDIRTINTGLAASFGSLILMNGTKGKRSGLKRSTVMLHNPLISGSGISGSCEDIVIETNELIRIKEQLYQTIIDCTGKTKEEVTADLSRNNWLSPEQALNYGTKGIIDFIITKDGNITRESEVKEEKKEEAKPKKARTPRKKKTETTPPIEVTPTKLEE